MARGRGGGEVCTSHSIRAGGDPKMSGDGPGMGTKEQGTRSGGALRRRVAGDRVPRAGTGQTQAPRWPQRGQGCPQGDTGVGTKPWEQGQILLIQPTEMVLGGAVAGDISGCPLGSGCPGRGFCVFFV